MKTSENEGLTPTASDSIARKAVSESSAKGSSIDLLASMRKGLTGVVTSGATSLVTAGAKWAIGKGLNAAFGWENKETKRQNWVESTLTNITEELYVISYDISVIDRNLTQLLQTSETNDYLAEYTSLVSSFDRYKDVVQTVWDPFANLMVDLSHPDANGTDAKERVEKIVRWNDKLELSITGIQNLLYSVDNEDSRTLMEAWTDACIKQLQFDNGNVVSKYLTLEAKLMHFLRWLNAAYILKVNIENYQEDLIIEESTKGIRYYEGHISKYMPRIMENWMKCVERLVISTYAADTDVERVYDVPTKLASAAEIQAIFERADLVNWLILSFDAPEPHVGLCYRSLTRPSLVKKGGGASVTPGTGFEASTGAVIPVDGSYQGDGHHMDHWFKCIDFADEAASRDAFKLRAFEDSDIQTVRYHWPLEGTDLKAGDVISKSSASPFNKVPLQYYSKQTLEPMQETEVVKDEFGVATNAVLMASRAEAEALRQNLFMDYAASYSENGWGFDYSGLRVDSIPGRNFASYKQGSRFKGKLPYYGETEVMLTYRNHTDRHERDVFVWLNIDYPEGSNRRPAHFLMESNYTAEIENYKTFAGTSSAKGHIDVKFKLDYPEDKYKGSGDRPDAFKDDIKNGIDKDKSNVDYKTKKPQMVTCIPKSRMRLRWIVRFHIDKGLETRSNTVSPPKQVERRLYGKWNVEKLRLVWPTPPMNIN